MYQGDNDNNNDKLYFLPPILKELSEKSTSFIPLFSFKETPSWFYKTYIMNINKLSKLK